MKRTTNAVAILELRYKSKSNKISPEEKWINRIGQIFAFDFRESPSIKHALEEAIKYGRRSGARKHK